MAARLNPRHQTAVREKIRGSQLVNRLQEHALARAGTKAGLKKLMTDAQVRAAMGLLAKCVPDLQRTELVGDGGGPVKFEKISFLNVKPDDLPA